MKLQLQTFKTLVQNGAAAVQGSARQLVDVSVGSITRAILEANASAALWMQWLVLLVLQATRLSTSSGADVDSFVGDFTLTRLPGTAASGTVLFSRFVGFGNVLIQPGALVRTGDGTQTFAVIGDATAPSWDSTQQGYPMPNGTLSVAVTVQAVATGIAGNVLPGAISLVASSLDGVDTVTNPLAFTNGVDSESDIALKARFVNYIGSLSRATKAAVAYAITTVQQGLSYYIQENINTDGTVSVGHFIVTVDDGTGQPPASLLSAVYAAVDLVRPIGSTFAVVAPAITHVGVTATIVPQPGINKSVLLGPIVVAVTGYLDALPIGTSVSYTRIIQVMYSATAGIGNITNLQINGSTSDIAIGPAGVAKAASVVLS